MNVKLPPDLLRRAEAEVAAGRAESVDALVSDAVREHLADIEWTDDKLKRMADEAAADYKKNGGVAWASARERLTARFKLDD